jgi:hypothetical protein
MIALFSDFWLQFGLAGFVNLKKTTWKKRTSLPKKRLRLHHNQVLTNGLKPTQKLRCILQFKLPKMNVEKMTGNQLGRTFARVQNEARTVVSIAFSLHPSVLSELFVLRLLNQCMLIRLHQI